MKKENRKDKPETVTKICSLHIVGGNRVKMEMW